MFVPSFSLPYNKYISLSIKVFFAIISLLIGNQLISGQLELKP